MIFVKYIPKHPLLRSIVYTFWYIEQSDRSVTDIYPRMFPDGYYHMVFNLAASHEYLDRSGRIYRPAHSHINAKQTDVLQIRRSGDVKIMGAIFKPYGLHALLRTPASEIAGSVLNVEQLLGNIVQEIEEKLHEALKLEDKFTILEQLFTSYLQHAPKLNPAVVYACQRMISSNGLMSISELAGDMQLSERSLERHFKTYVGITPKQFADIQRMQYILTQLSDHQKKPLIQIAHEGRYYDQAHFNHSFQRMLGMTPQQYIRKRDLLSDLYNTEKKERGMIDGNTMKE